MPEQMMVVLALELAEPVLVKQVLESFESHVSQKTEGLEAESLVVVEPVELNNWADFA
jgi:hypothetical protein